MPKTRRKFVYRTIKRFQDTNSVKDKPRSGRPVSVTTTKMKKVVRSRILRNPRRSIRKMAAQLKMSPKSLRTIVRRGLGLSSYKIRKVHLISTLVREKRLSRSKGLLNGSPILAWTRSCSPTRNFSLWKKFLIPKTTEFCLSPFLLSLTSSDT